MSIASQINRIQTNISDAYSAVSAKGGTVPFLPNSANLATAIRSIPQEKTGVLEIYNATTSTYNSGTESDVNPGYYVEAFWRYGQKSQVADTDDNEEKVFPQRYFSFGKEVNDQGQTIEKIMVFQKQNGGNYYGSSYGDFYYAYVLQYNYNTMALTTISNVVQLPVQYIGGAGEDQIYTSLLNIVQLDNNHFAQFSGKSNQYSVANGTSVRYILITVSADRTQVSVSYPIGNNLVYNKPELSTSGLPCYLFKVPGQDSKKYLFVHVRERKPSVTLLQMNDDYTFTDLWHQTLATNYWSHDSDAGFTDHQNLVVACDMKQDEDGEWHVMVSLNLYYLEFRTPSSSSMVFDTYSHAWSVTNVIDPSGGPSGGSSPSVHPSCPRGSFIVSMVGYNSTPTITEMFPAEVIDETTNEERMVWWGTPTRENDVMGYSDTKGQMPILKNFRYVYPLIVKNFWNYEEYPMILDVSRENAYIYYRAYSSYYQKVIWKTMKLPYTFSTYGAMPPQVFYKSTGDTINYNKLVINYLDERQKPMLIRLDLENMTPYSNIDHNFNIEFATNPDVNYPSTIATIYRGYGYLLQDFENRNRKVTHILGSGQVYIQYWANYNNTLVVQACGTSDYGIPIGVTGTTATPDAARGTVYLIPYKT